MTNRPARPIRRRSDSTEIAGWPAHSVNAGRVDLAPQDTSNLGSPPIAVTSRRGGNPTRLTARAKQFGLIFAFYGSYCKTLLYRYSPCCNAASSRTCLHRPRQATRNASSLHNVRTINYRLIPKWWKKMLWGKRRDSWKIVASINLQLTELPMQKLHDNSKASPAAFMQDNTLIAVIELSLNRSGFAGGSNS